MNLIVKKSLPSIWLRVRTLNYGNLSRRETSTDALSHVDDTNKPTMVDVSHKMTTLRSARAQVL